ncbi:MAG TPA: hypothetical protein VN866_01365, partial [Mycobacterium sp.]|nr:hypothetical protein [Mycobacterium sp.]
MSPPIRHLFQAALLPDTAAAAAWRKVEPELDLDDPVLARVEVFALLSRRLPELGIDYPGLPLFVGVRRHNWARCELVMNDLAARIRVRSNQPVVVGRAATVAAYLPESGLAPIGTAFVAEDTPGRTLTVVVKDVAMRVPAPAEHLVWAVESGQWLDAAFAVQHTAMSWEAVKGIAAARRRPRRLHAGLVMLSELAGVSVPMDVLDSVRPGRVRSISCRVIEAGLAVVHLILRRRPTGDGRVIGRPSL